MAGLLLAAGSGERFGQPKALVETGSGPWVRTALAVLADCDEIVVVIGAQADRVAKLLPDDVLSVINPGFATGMGSSLRAGLRAVAATGADAVLVMLVDLPDVTAGVIERLAAHLRSSATPTTVLARAAYDGRPGHPVLIGRDHFAGVIDGAAGDAGARDYLAAHGADLIECGDVGGGRDVDSPDQL